MYILAKIILNSISLYQLVGKKKFLTLRHGCNKNRYIERATQLSYLILMKTQYAKTSKTIKQSN